MLFQFLNGGFKEIQMNVDTLLTCEIIKCAGLFKMVLIFSSPKENDRSKVESLF